MQLIFGIVYVAHTGITFEINFQLNSLNALYNAQIASNNILIMLICNDAETYFKRIFRWKSIVSMLIWFLALGTHTIRLMCADCWFNNLCLFVVLFWYSIKYSVTCEQYRIVDIWHHCSIFIWQMCSFYNFMHLEFIQCQLI